MNILIFSVIFGILFMLLGTVPSFNEKPRQLKLISIIAVLILIFISFLELIDTPLFTYTSSFLAFHTYERYFLSIMEGCLLYFLIQNGDKIIAINRPFPEQIALLFFTIAGGAILVSVSNLLLLFLGIETVSLPLYVFTGLNIKNLKNNEATLKYFLMGAFFTGILLMGITLLYGSIGSFDIEFIAKHLNNQDYLQLIGITLILIALAFKVSAAPFHFWTPDAYEGAPTPYTGFMASVAKVFFFMAFIKIFHYGFSDLSTVWSTQVNLLIITTLIISNLTALAQNGLKRLMSYSSIAQAAFMLFAIYGNNQYATDGLFIYAVSYTLAVLGIFAIIATPISDKPIATLNGLIKTNPVLAITLAVFIFSLIGIPFTGGFIGKYYMLLSAISNNIHWSVLLIAFIASAISAFYYLNIINSSFFKNQTELTIAIPSNKKFEIALVINALLLIILGIRPSWLLHFLNY